MSCVTAFVIIYSYFFVLRFKHAVPTQSSVAGPNFCISGARAGLKPTGPIASIWAPRPILQTLVQVDWEAGPTEIVPNIGSQSTLALRSVELGAGPCH